MSFVTDTQAPAVLFPGQGSQTPEMRDLVARLAPDLLERCHRARGRGPVRPRRARAPASPSPRSSARASPAATRSASSRGVAAGHSLGELAALAAAGVLDRDDALELVVLRGRLMAEADDTGSMLALVGATDEEAREIAAHAGVTVANDNAPGQVVLSGAARRRSRTAEEAARERGRRALPAQRRRRVPLAAAWSRPSRRSARRSTTIELHDAALPRRLAARPRSRSRTSAPSSPPR